MRLDDSEMSLKSFTQRADGGQEPDYSGVRRQPVKFHHDDTERGQLKPDYQVAKTPVLGQHNPAVARRTRKHIAVVFPLELAVDDEDVVTGRAHSVSQGTRQALVG